uniref:Protein OrfX2/OrfX3/P47 domain-containing protein n=1 Tax=Fusarium oxysporum (strain Fo5176) TaxID=660025 RepID=A0A0D2XF06_FUSOF
MAVQAEFGSWQITVGGAANMLMFDIPLSYIRGRVTKDRQTIAHFSYQSLAARVQLVLKFVNSKEKSHDLVVDPTNPPTSLVSLMDANGRPLPSAIDKAFITEALTTWLNGNLSEFNHVFASVELDPGVGSDTQWAFCSVYAFANDVHHGLLGAGSTSAVWYPGSVTESRHKSIDGGSECRREYPTA